MTLVTRLSLLASTAVFVVGCAATNAPAPADTAPVSEAAPASSPAYTFAWMFLDDEAEMTPRGGTTTGPAVTPVSEPSAAWQALQADGLTKQERDRRAILAMAGGYRASFDFLETVGFTEGYVPAKPYRSWGTEHVYVVENQPDFVSLQHILVMFFEDQEGNLQGPAVVKHWRQDWQYEDTDLNVYIGHDRWAQRSIDADSVGGTWSQSVYQVDDSPRYQAIGAWVHDANYSAWESNTTWRPLPRREYSVRSDYHALVGTNRHTILPTGWLHEEDNLKTVLDEDGDPIDGARYLAREYGVNRYELIEDHDFSAGDAYWEKTAAFWSDVRDAWDEKLASEAVVTKAKVDGMPLLMQMLSYSSEITDYDSDTGRAYIKEQLAKFYE